MIRCKEVATLISSDLLASKSLLKRVEIRLHLMMCEHCSRLLRQMKQLRAAARRIAGSIDHELDCEAGKEMEARLLRKLSRGPDNPPQS
jgi:hypothetical protein